MERALALIGLFIVTLWANAAGAVPVFKDEEKGIAVNVGVLVQPTFQITMPGSNGDGPGACDPAGARNRCSAGIGNARGDGPAYDLFLRRARLLVWGNATKDLAYFVGTNEPNLGKGGVLSTSPGTFIEDAFLSYTVMPELKVDAGLMYVPLSHHTMEAASSLNALDYHADLIKFPTSRNLRDIGVQLRGLALRDYLHYRLGIFEGVRNSAFGAVPANTSAAGAPANTRTLVNPGDPFLLDESTYQLDQLVNLLKGSAQSPIKAHIKDPVSISKAAQQFADLLQARSIALQYKLTEATPVDVVTSKTTIGEPTFLDSTTSDGKYVYKVDMQFFYSGIETGQMMIIKVYRDGIQDPSWSFNQRWSSEQTTGTANFTISPSFSSTYLVAHGVYTVDIYINGQRLNQGRWFKFRASVLNTWPAFDSCRGFIQKNNCKPWR